MQRVGQRVERVVARDGREHQAQVRHVARHGAEHGERVPAVRAARVGHQAGRGAEAHDAVEGGGVAQAAARVRAGGEGHHVAGQRDGRAARGAGGVLRRVEGVARRAPHRVAGVRAEAELGDVGLAEDHAARGADAGDDAVVVVRHVVGEERAAPGGSQALGGLEILDAERQAVERAERRVAARHLGLAFLRAGAGGALVHRGHRVDGGVHLRDAGEAGVQEFDGREAASADEAASFGGREVAGLGGHGAEARAAARACRGSGNQPVRSPRNRTLQLPGKRVPNNSRSTASLRSSSRPRPLDDQFASEKAIWPGICAGLS